MEKRKAVSIPPDMWQELSALAAVRANSTAALVREVMTEYLDNHRREVNDALEIVGNYQSTLEAFRQKNSAE